MPHDRFEWHDRIKAVERECRLTQLGLVRLDADARVDSAILRDAGSVGGSRALGDAIRNAEGTYLIRMFAEFENALRSYWRTLRPTVPVTRDLVDGVASQRRVGDGLRLDVHRVRNYRNQLVHEFESGADPVPIADARGHLNRFLRRLPEGWG